MYELKPCPFCGKANAWPIRYALRGGVFHEHEVAYRWCVICPDCGGSVDKGFFVGRDDAVEAWNRRAGEDNKGA